jgi:Transglutaminase-like superfamily
MGLLTRSIRLPAADWRLLVRAGTLLVVMRLALPVLPFRIIRKLGRETSQVDRSDPLLPLPRIVWALGWANRIFPGATCLPRALAAESLLRRMGHPAILHIGVARGRRRPVDAHAWVECGGEVVAGGDVVGRYIVLGSGTMLP